MVMPYTGDIAIVDGFFACIGSYERISEIDAAGSFVSPTFIDGHGHVHIEFPMVRHSELSNILLFRGVTCIVTEPLEIANVSGKKAFNL